MVLEIADIVIKKWEGVSVVPSTASNRGKYHIYTIFVTIKMSWLGKMVLIRNRRKLKLYLLTDITTTKSKKSLGRIQKNTL